MNDGVNDIDRLLASLADAESRVDAPRRSNSDYSGR